MNATRRLLLGTVLATPFVKPLAAQQREISVGIWGGAQGDYVKRQIIPAFERDFGCKVLPEEGFTLANVSKMRATKDNPRFSVMFIDDLAIPIAKAEGLIAELPRDRMPAMANLYPRFLYEEGFGTALGISLGGIFHNTRVRPPESYAELWEPRYRGKLKLVSPNNTPSMFFLIVAAAIETGKPFAEAQYEIDKAFDRVVALRPNILNIFGDGIQAANEVAQGQADIGLVEYSKYIYPYTNRRAPVTMAFPKEGSFAGTNCQVLVKNGPHQDLAVAFMNRMIEPAVQKGLSEFALTSPPVSGITFAPETARWIAYPVEEMDKRGLFTPDWTYINARRAGWTERLNRIFSL